MAHQSCLQCFNLAENLVVFVRFDFLTAETGTRMWRLAVTLALECGAWLSHSAVLHNTRVDTGGVCSLFGTACYRVNSNNYRGYKIDVGLQDIA